MLFNGTYSTVALLLAVGPDNNLKVRLSSDSHQIHDKHFEVIME